jgi:hypothetical protein
MSFKPFASLFRSSTRTNQRGRSSGRLRFPGLFVESLEERTVPTVIFDPVFPKETLAKSAPYTVLNDPTVYLIFWGSGWTKDEASAWATDAQTIINSSYLSELKEYGSDGKAHYSPYWIDPSSPPSGYDPGAGGNDSNGNSSSADMQAEIKKAIEDPTSPIFGPPANATITQAPVYVVIPDPVDSNQTNAGYNSPQTYGTSAINSISIGTWLNNQSYFDDRFSHELAERMSDPGEDGTGVELQWPTSSSFPSYLKNSGIIQIGDGEAEMGGEVHYFYQLGQKGPNVQPLWSASTPDSSGSNGAFIVKDGNSQNVYLQAIWNQGQIPNTNPQQYGLIPNGHYNLVLKGDQSGAGQSDTITINASDSGVAIKENGQSFYFANGSDDGQIDNITVEAGTGTNTINVQGLDADQSITIDSAGSDTVRVGFAHDITTFKGTMSIYNNNSQGVNLTVDDSTDGTTRTITQTQNIQTGLSTVSWSSLGTINYAAQTLTTLKILGGHGTNSFSFAVSTSNCTTTIDTGDGNDSITFQATSGVLNVVANPPSSSGSSTGQDTVTIGSPTPTLNGDSPIFGVVNVSNKVGSTALIIDDSADQYPGLTFTVNGGAITNNSPLAAPARIAYGAGVNSVEFHIGSGGSTFNVLSSSNKLTLDSTTGKDTVNLANATHNLNAIANVSVNGRGNTTVNVNDRGNQSAYLPYTIYIPLQTAYSIGGDTLTRSALGLAFLQGFPTPVPAGAGLSLSYNNIAALNVLGGPAGLLTYQVTSTLGASAVTLKASGTDIVMVGSPASNLNDVSGLTVNGDGSTLVTLDDRGNELPPFLNLAYTPLSTAYTIGNQSLTRVAQGFAVNLFGQLSVVTAGLSLHYSNLAGMTIDGGPGGVFTYQVRNTIGTNGLTFNALGVDIVSLGAPGANLGGLVAPIQVNGNGATVVTVDDRGNSMPFLPYAAYSPIVSAYTMTAGSLTRIAQSIGFLPPVGPIPVVAGFSLGYGNLADLTIEGGPAGVFTYQVDSTAGAGDVTINARSTDLVAAGDSSNNLDNVSNLSVNGDGSTVLVLDDEANHNQTVSNGSVAVSTSLIYLINNSSVTRTNTVTDTLVATGQALSTSNIAGLFDYTKLASLTVQGGNSGNVFDVTSTAPATTVIAGNASDTVNVGASTTNLDGIGTLTVKGGAGTTLNLDDQANHNRRGAGVLGPILVLTSPTYAISGQGVTRTNTLTTVSLVTGSVLSTRTLTATINFSNVSNLGVLGGQTGNTFDVLASGPSTPLTINAGLGNDVANVGSAANTIDTIQGLVTISGGGGTDTLNYNDQGATVSGPWTYTFTSQSLERNSLPVVSYSGMATVNISLAVAPPSYIVPELVSTVQGTTYNVFGGSGENEYFIGDNQDTLNEIAGPIFLHASGDGPGNDNLLFFFDNFNPNSESFLLSAGAGSESGEVQRFNPVSSAPDMAPVNFDGMNGYAILEVGQSANVNIVSVAPALLETIVAGTGDTVTVGSQAPALGGTLANIVGDVGVEAYVGQSPPNVVIDDSGDTATGPRTVDLHSLSYAYEIDGLGNGSNGRGRIFLTVTPTTPVSIDAGAADDTFHFEDFTMAPALTINGGGGSNTLDYSGYSGDVTVDLALGTATGLAGFSNFQNVIGSNGNSLIVGDANADVLTGGTGRNIIIGGAGLDTITGGAGDNVLIGGATSYDTLNLPALEQIMQEWLQPSDIATRMSAIQNGTDLLLNTGIQLDSSTLIPDGQANVINPGPGGNWIVP